MNSMDGYNSPVLLRVHLNVPIFCVLINIDAQKHETRLRKRHVHLHLCEYSNEATVWVDAIVCRSVQAPESKQFQTAAILIIQWRHKRRRYVM